jgi:chromate reductase, NAD(P)H dehydrogenase (quinone)
MTIKILAFAGSTRKESLNKKLARIAAAAAEAAGAQVTFIDLRDYPLPLYDGDLEEEHFPDNALTLKQIFLEHQGLLIASPEYNSSFSGVLKNAIDWISRPQEGEAPLACFNGKVAAIMATSPGALGGLRGLTPLRMLLENIQVTVLPTQIAIPSGMAAFAPEGLSLLDSKQQDQVIGLSGKLVQILTKLHA